MRDRPLQQMMSCLSRGRHLAAMRREGLNLESPEGNRQIRDAFSPTIPPKSASSILCSSASNADDTDPTAANLASLIGDRTIILSLQNGVDNADKDRTAMGQ